MKRLNNKFNKEFCKHIRLFGAYCWDCYTNFAQMKAQGGERDFPVQGYFPSKIHIEGVALTKQQKYFMNHLGEENKAVRPINKSGNS